MSETIPEKYMDLIHNPVVASLATMRKDGSPHVTPVWFDYDGIHVRINSAQGRVKDLNMRNNPKVALCIIDPGNPYRYLEIRGRVVDISEAGADEHIDHLAKKYLNVDKYPHRSPNEVRVRYLIVAEHVSAMG
jgi:PPOX class probable F420-dependent enzyme